MNPSHHVLLLVISIIYPLFTCPISIVTSTIPVPLALPHHHQAPPPPPCLMRWRYMRKSEHFFYKFIGRGKLRLLVCPFSLSGVIIISIGKRTTVVLLVLRLIIILDLVLWSNLHDQNAALVQLFGENNGSILRRIELKRWGRLGLMLCPPLFIYHHPTIIILQSTTMMNKTHTYIQQSTRG